MPISKQVTAIMFSNFSAISIHRSVVEEVSRIQHEEEQEGQICSGILSRSRFDLIRTQFIRTEGQSGSFSHYLQCGDTEGNKLVVGTEVGMAMLRVHAAPIEAQISTVSDKKIEHQWTVLEKKLFHKLAVVEELGLTLAILGLKLHLACVGGGAYT